MAMIPFACGNSDRADFIALESSLMLSLGSFITNEQMSNVEIICNAIARGIYNARQVLGNASNQFYPQTMDTTLSRWETIFNLQPSPTEDLEARRNAIQEKFSLLNQVPTVANLSALCTALIPQIFEQVVVVPENTARGGGIPAPIVGGIPTITDPNKWYSTAASVFIDLHRPQGMNNASFWQQAYKIHESVNEYIPAWDFWDWFSSSFNMCSSTGVPSTFSVALGDTAVTTSGLPCAFDGYVWPGSIIEAFDGYGKWHRLTFLSTTTTGGVLTSPSPATFTAQPFWIQGFFADCDPTQVPYPQNAFNTDNAGMDDYPLGGLNGLQWLLPFTSFANLYYCNCPSVVTQVTSLTGIPGITYSVTLRIRGVIETKAYTGGTSTGYLNVGGTPSVTPWNVYSLVVGSPSQTYYLNNGVDSEYMVHVVDYEITVPITTGSTVTLYASSEGGQEITNQNGSNYPSGPISAPLSVPSLAPYGPAQPYNGQFLVMNVINVSY